HLSAAITLLHSFPTRRSSDLRLRSAISLLARILSAVALATFSILPRMGNMAWVLRSRACLALPPALSPSTMNSSVSPSPSPEQRSEEHTSELQSRENLVCRLL